MRSMSRGPLVATAVVLGTALSAVPGRPARADFYVCVDADGKPWHTNQKQPGQNCKIMLKTGDSAPAASGDGGASGAGSTWKPTSRPPGVDDGAVPRAVEEPSSVQERKAEYMPLLAEAAGRYKLPVAFLAAIMRVESNFRYRAVSSAGAEGLMQLMPDTARAMGVNDPFDPRQNVFGAARLVRVLANRYDGDMVKVLSAYHAGSGAVADKGGIPYEGTEGYVRAVLDSYYLYRAME